MNLPNAITGLRFLLVPVFAWLYLTERPGWALAAFVVAALSDSIDGLLARILHQQTEIGAILDPIADKLLGFVALVLLVVSGEVPLWFLLLAMLRDVVVIGVGVTAKMGHRAIHAVPTRVSKYATFGEMTLVTLSLIARAGEQEPLRPMIAAVGLITAQCLVVATGQYLLRGRRLLRGMPAKEGV